jgi:hypothetical protein
MPATRKVVMVFGCHRSYYFGMRSYEFGLRRGGVPASSVFFAVAIAAS